MFWVRQFWQCRMSIRRICLASDDSWDWKVQITNGGDWDTRDIGVISLITRPWVQLYTEDEEAECDDMMAADISGDLEHVKWCHMMSGSPVWHQMTSDDGIMISVTRFSDLSPPPHAKSENDSRGVAGAQLKPSGCQQLDRDKIPRLDLPNFRWSLMSLSLRKVNIPWSELYNIWDWLHNKSGMMTGTEKTKEVNDMFLIRVSGAVWAHCSLSLSIPL